MKELQESRLSQSTLEDDSDAGRRKEARDMIGYVGDDDDDDGR